MSAKEERFRKTPGIRGRGTEVGEREREAAPVIFHAGGGSKVRNVQRERERATITTTARNLARIAADAANSNTSEASAVSLFAEHYFLYQQG